MNVDMNEVIAKLDEAPSGVPLGDAPLIAVHDGNAEIAHRLKRIDSAVRLIAVVIVVPVVVKLVLGLVGAVVGAGYAAKYGKGALAKLRHDFPTLDTAIRDAKLGAKLDAKLDAKAEAGGGANLIPDPGGWSHGRL